MTRHERIGLYRRRLVIAIGISAGLHAAALALVELAIPTIEPDTGSRPLRVVELPDDWEDSAIEVVALETARYTETAESAGAGDAPAAPETGTETPAPSALPRAVAPSASPNPHALNTAPASAAPIIEIALPRSNRGVIRRSGGDAPEPALRFVAASEAALRAERDRDTDARGRDGREGIGFEIMIPGMGGGACSGGSIPILPQPSAGLGGVPMAGKGRGIIGARPPGGEAINRVGPPIGGS